MSAEIIDEIDWLQPLEVSRGLKVPVTVYADDGDCKWLRMGDGVWMFNNDGTGVDCHWHVRNIPSPPVPS
ncbi:hypothetical protein [Aureimonas glaciei]|uniref:Uncharacterized protein n=1 Tax=Aureimonas glaciei TaxID=1776957 RepID=A0A916XUX3_9HYPH|nr:hypothetical protein [Aureimonas glaciei]GGD11777.1 hypothetical protein GCM10011335_13460 [Aureimonas glaciei]